MVDVPEDIQALLLDEQRTTWVCEAGHISCSMVPLGRELYVRVKRVMVDLGGKWSRKDKVHWFAQDPRPQLKEGQYLFNADLFETPHELALVMAQYVRGYDVVIDPSAGLGALPAAVKEVSLGSRVLVDDIDPRCRDVLAGKGLIVLDEPHDFLDAEYTPDAFIMNPPWSNYTGADHVEKAYSLVREGGRIVCLLSSWFWSSSHVRAVAFREWLVEIPRKAVHDQGEWEFKGRNRAGKTKMYCQILVIDKEDR